jgi:hypothetical protein
VDILPPHEVFVMMVILAFFMALGITVVTTPLKKK